METATDAPAYLWKGKYWCPDHAPSKLVPVHDTRTYRNDNGARPRLVSETRACAECGVVMKAKVEDRI